MNLRQTRVQRLLAAIEADSAEDGASSSDTDLRAMFGALGPALLEASQATNEVEVTLQGLARAYGRPDIRVFVLPTLIIIEDPKTEKTAVFPATGEPLRLDQAGSIEELVHRAAAEQLDPAHVVSEVERITRLKPRFGFLLSLLGQVLLTLGFGMVMNPTPTAVPIYAALGLVVGLIVMIGSRVRTLSLVLPVLTAFLATVAVSLASQSVTEGNVLLLVAPALVSLLPGLTLTIAAVELTNGQIMAGASRLVYGFARLGLLAFGVYVGITVTGASLTENTSSDRLGAWAPWVGILLVGVGYYFSEVAPKRSLLWIVFALALAYAAQLLGHSLLGTELSGMVGALVAVPAIYLASHLRAAPPPAVMLTCAYWMLVPGALGFIGLSEAASGAAGAAGTLMQTIGSIVAIAIGMVLGTGISRDTGAAARAWNRHGAVTQTGVSSGPAAKSAEPQLRR
ncbi:threonine/serine ThrE exporter family protein [Pseudoclavibacter sp. 8L]|uniref:threonine/serine ThrE exporter family protein n=1 Tax=Pseudoclavibacter sp. 8L TaxID=2653162 RepID=UPI0012EEE53A|nr:threonine/serine exporter family protein [Pseudoclavibacter sp. 8L]VXB67229.1 conserved membrane hypothetical protein [Pseudoclavibacter sp. 8L]